MPVEVMHAFNKKYDVTILEGYGLSETSPVASFNHPGRDPKPGSIGTPIWGVEMRCVDADALYRRLLSVGVVVRNVSHYPSMGGCLRISVGSPSDHARLLAALGVRVEAA